MSKRVTLNYDFVAIVIIIFISSCGFNIYQNARYQKLFAAHVDMTWSAQDAEANLVYVRKQLESCENNTDPGI